MKCKVHFNLADPSRIAFLFLSMIQISSLLSSFSETFWRKSFSYFRFVKISWRVYKYPVINLRQAPPFANLQTSVNLKRYPSPLSYLISSAAILSQIVLSLAVFLTFPVLSPRKINEKGTPWYYQFISRIDLCGKWLFFLCSQPLSYPVRILFMQIDRLQLKETMFTFQTICLVLLGFCPLITTFWVLDYFEWLLSTRPPFLQSLLLLFGFINILVMKLKYYRGVPGILSPF